MRIRLGITKIMHRETNLTGKMTARPMATHLYPTDICASKSHGNVLEVNYLGTLVG